MKLSSKTFYFLFILFTHNNIICTLTNEFGKTLLWSSTGEKKQKGLKKTNLTSINFIINKLCKYSKNSNIIYVRIKGTNKNKNLFLKKLKSFNFNLLMIQENLNIPYNGCKRTKIRRV